MAPTPRWRPTARLFVVDPDERVLLFSAADADGTVWWFTPGGGMRRGETLARAAVRELAEETGYACTEGELGPLVATCTGIWTPQDSDRPYFAADSFFLVRVTHPDVDTAGQEELERAVITGHRWWTLEEIHGDAKHIFPAGLAGLVSRLLAGDIPASPVRLPWS